MLKKLIVMLMLFVLAVPLFAEETGAQKGKVVIEAAEDSDTAVDESKKQLKIRNRNCFKKMNKKPTKKGVDKKGIEAANEACERLCEAGLTPEEAQKQTTRNVVKLMKKGVSGEKLAAQVKTRCEEQLKTMKQNRIRKRKKEMSAEKGDELKEKNRTRSGSGSGNHGKSKGK